MTRSTHTPTEPIPLHRLLKRSNAQALLDTFAGTFPDGDLALVRADGRFFVGTGQWSQAIPDDISDLKTTLAHSIKDKIISLSNCTLYPLWVDEHLIGGLLTPPFSSEKASLTQPLYHSLTLLLAQAVEKREVAQEALERYREINLLYRISETINASLDSEEIPQMVLNEAIRVINADVGVVLVEQIDGDGKLVTKASHGTPSQIDDLCANALHLVAEAYRSNQTDGLVTPVIEAWTAADLILCTPLKTDDRVFGAILLSRQDETFEFTAGDDKLLMALTNQAAIALEQARLHQQEIARQRIEEELAVGRQIQHSLLPAACPSVPGWEFAAVYQSARQVGGDLYDFFELSNAPHNLGIVIADVTGKGVPAALFMAFSRSIIRHESVTGDSPKAVLEQANRLIFADNRSKLFLSAFYTTLNLNTGCLTYASGGHNWPFWFQAATQEITELDAKGFVLGAVEEIDLEQREIPVLPGDYLIFFTDGAIEAINAEDEMFGEARLKSIVNRLDDKTAQQILDKIVDTLTDFIGDTPQADDFTIIVVKRLINSTVSRESA
ncbi:MAG: PP2C family protein-serine/threonine phosphatase [Chloroflexota bacterium]